MKSILFIQTGEIREIKYILTTTPHKDNEYVVFSDCLDYADWEVISIDEKNQGI